MIKFIVKLLIMFCRWRKKEFHIMGNNNEDVFLVRYILFKSKSFSIYIHRFLHSDADDPHSHPWDFYTYVVEHGYQEYFYDMNRPVVEENVFKSYWSLEIRDRKPGSLEFRNNTDIHRVVIPKSYTLEEIEQAPLTICLMLKRKSSWGFWKNGCYFIDWREYLNISPDDKRIEGSE